MDTAPTDSSSHCLRTLWDTSPRSHICQGETPCQNFRCSQRGTSRREVTAVRTTLPPPPDLGNTDLLRRSRRRRVNAFFPL
ncbi:unnamed protein product [Bubo scandiacus]